MKRKKVLIVGALPPPIGGVSIHLERVLIWLKSSNFNAAFCSTTNGYFFNVFKSALKTDVIHLHVSNSTVRLIQVIVLRFLLFKKVVFTVHGKIGKHKGFLDYNIDKLALMLVNIPILLNDQTFQLAKKLNKNSMIFTAFIPPSNFEAELNKRTNEELNSFLINKNETRIFCTNASSLAFDQTGNEIYGIGLLLNVFKNLDQSFKLIISDPTGENYKAAKLQNQLYPNVFFITERHNFSGIITKSNCFIRATTTDGDPLSIKESLILETPVIASDCIERPNSVITFQSKDINSLKATILAFKPFKPKVIIKSGLEDLDKLYKSIL